MTIFVIVLARVTVAVVMAFFVVVVAVAIFIVVAFTIVVMAVTLFTLIGIGGLLLLVCGARCISTTGQGCDRQASDHDHDARYQRV